MNGTRTSSKSRLTSALAAELRVELGKLARRLREHAHPDDFTTAQKSVVLRLERDGPATVTALARAEGMRPQSLGATISSLEAVHFVHGTPDPGDRRQTILSLTPSCREMLRSTRAAKEDWLFRMIQRELTHPEQLELASAVELLKRLANS